MDKFLYTDPHTKMQVVYTELDSLVIYVRNGTNKPKELCRFSGDKIHAAFTKYHALILPKKWKKSLYHLKSSDEPGVKHKIYSHHGYGEPSTTPSPITFKLAKSNASKGKPFQIRVSDIPDCLVDEILLINNLELGLPSRGMMANLVKLLLASFLYVPPSMQKENLKLARSRLEEMKERKANGIK